MALLSFQEERQRARKMVPFANEFEYDSWYAIWCEDCVHKATCSLLVVVLLDRKTPAAWQDENPGALNRYHCAEFTGEETQVQDEDSSRAALVEPVGAEFDKHEENEGVDHWRD